MNISFFRNGKSGKRELCVAFKCKNGFITSKLIRIEKLTILKSERFVAFISINCTCVFFFVQNNHLHEAYFYIAVSIINKPFFWLLYVSMFCVQFSKCHFVGVMFYGFFFVYCYYLLYTLFYYLCFK